MFILKLSVQITKPLNSLKSASSPSSLLTASNYEETEIKEKDKNGYAQNRNTRNATPST
jgi:hypothetical protein